MFIIMEDIILLRPSPIDVTESSRGKVARDLVGSNGGGHRGVKVSTDFCPTCTSYKQFATQPSIVRIAHELGVDDQPVFADESLPPWVNYNGKLHPLPKGKDSKGPEEVR